MSVEIKPQQIGKAVITDVDNDRAMLVFEGNRVYLHTSRTIGVYLNESDCRVVAEALIKMADQMKDAER